VTRRRQCICDVRDPCGCSARRDAPRPRADDYEDEESGVEALSGNAQPAGNADELSGLLLEMASATTKLAIQLGELDSEGFAHIAPRLATFVGLVGALPRAGRPRRAVGFAMAAKKKGKR
jgi:hypothetical protein